MKKNAARVWQGNRGLEVETSGRGVTGIRLLRRRAGAKAAPSRLSPAVGQILKEMKAYLAGRRRFFSARPVVIGSPFARKVLRALGKVPYGTTVTYGDLARRAGFPGAARAVGTVMKNNRLPILLPCHRVVAGKGLGGFSAGMEWKKHLLELEGTKL